MTDTSKRAYWIPQTGSLSEMEQAMLACNLPKRQPITQQAISQALQTKIHSQLVEYNRHSPLQILEATEDQELIELVDNKMELANLLKLEALALVSQLDLNKESQLWQNQVNPINQSEVRLIDQESTLHKLLNV